MILTKVCWKQELWISESRKKPTLCEECKVSAFFVAKHTTKRSGGPFLLYRKVLKSENIGYNE